MSTRASPFASGPLRPRKGDTRRAANPLRRTSDKVESWFRRVLMCALVLGLPTAALGAGLTTYETYMRTVRVWVNRDGSITSAPMSSVAAEHNGWFVGGAAALCWVSGVCAARAAVRRALDRRKYAQWDLEWNLVEPLWSGRFRR